MFACNGCGSARIIRISQVDWQTHMVMFMQLNLHYFTSVLVKFIAHIPRRMPCSAEKECVLPSREGVESGVVQVGPVRHTGARHCMGNLAVLACAHHLQIRK